MLLTGQPADIGVMDITQLRGISRNAPYFHNNSAATLEEVLDHYNAFFARVISIRCRPRSPPRKRVLKWAAHEAHRLLRTAPR
jgi:hypothetical protein